MEIPPALERALIPLVMLLNLQKIPKYRICEEKRPRTQNGNDFIIPRVMFTCLFEGETSNRAELDYKNKTRCSSQGVSILYI